MKINKILIIQTAFLGDVVLATALVEKLHKHYPNSEITMLVRKGNEGLLTDHPILYKVLVWDKKKQKIRNLLKLLKQVRNTKFDLVVNLQRFGASGLLTAFSGANTTIGFDKNPFSAFFTYKYPHNLTKGIHELDRNQSLIARFTDSNFTLPRLYPSVSDYDMVNTYVQANYFCIAPTSVWFTKQFPGDQWAKLIQNLPKGVPVYLLGAPSDLEKCNAIIEKSGNGCCVNLAGSLSLLQSAALMEKATMNYVNDSAPLHIATAMGANVIAVFCSTIPNFGFGPVGSKGHLVETTENLTCRPCGLHGHAKCPMGHFKCATAITTSSLLAPLSRV